MIWVIASYGWSIEGYDSRIYQWSPFSLFVKRSSNLSSVALLIIFGAHISLAVGFLWSLMFSETFVLCRGFLLFSFFSVFFYGFGLVLDWYWERWGRRKNNIWKPRIFVDKCMGIILQEQNIILLSCFLVFLFSKRNEIFLFWTTSNLISIVDNFLSWT